jgi:hypothetical protein
MVVGGTPKAVPVIDSTGYEAYMHCADRTYASGL